LSPLWPYASIPVVAFPQSCVFLIVPREDFHEIFAFALLSGNASAHTHILESENEGHAIVSNPRHMSTFCEIGGDAPLHLAAPAAHKRA
jgi:hypothetical protein